LRQIAGRADLSPIYERAELHEQSVTQVAAGVRKGTKEEKDKYFIEP
jgi:hypothetical protein